MLAKLAKRAGIGCNISRDVGAWTQGEAMKKWILCVATMLALCSGVARADAFDDGKAAYDKGDYAQAIRIWRPMAEKGNARAQTNLGYLYAEGRGVTQDYREAVKWYRLAAAQGYADAQNNLGVMYANGDGVTQDYREAVKWWRLAAAQGEANAQNGLGVVYADGLGVTQDYRESFKWWRLAAAQGNAGAQANLAKHTFSTEKGPEQTEAAARAQQIDKYQFAIRHKITGYIVLPSGIRGNPEVEFDLVLLPDGHTLSVKLRRSSGNEKYDSAVERAIIKAQPLPVPSDPKLFTEDFRELNLIFRILE